MSISGYFNSKSWNTIKDQFSEGIKGSQVERAFKSAQEMISPKTSSLETVILPSVEIEKESPSLPNPSKIQDVVTKTLGDFSTGAVGNIVAFAAVHHLIASFVDLNLAQRSSAMLTLGTGLAWFLDQDLYLGAGVGIASGYAHHILTRQLPDVYGKRVDEVFDIYKKINIQLFRYGAASVIGYNIWRLSPQVFQNPFLDHSIKAAMTLISLGALESQFNNLFRNAQVIERPLQ